jgi:hypothetical protein
MTKQKGAQKRDTSARALMPAKTRSRITLGFQLDIAKDNVEFFLAVKEWLAGQRSWKRYMMDGLRLFYDLSSGSTVVLLELFPNIREMLGQGCDDNSETLREILENQRLLLERGIAPPANGNGLLMQPLSGGQQPITTGKTLGGFKPLPPPTDDEDLPAIITRKDTNTDCNANFMKGLSQLH